MARRGFLGRIVDRVRSIVAPPPPPPPPPPRGPEPPAPVPRGSDFSVWRRAKGKGSFRRNRALFNKTIENIEQDLTRDERTQLWDTYVRNLATSGKARRNNVLGDFWQESGIHPLDFDWREWRIANNYRRKGD